MKTLPLWIMVASAGFAGCANEETDETSTRQDAVEVVPGNPTCADLGLGAFSFKIDPPTGGTYGLDDALGGTNTVTFVTDGIYADWSASIPIDAVIVKGGPMANVYVYDPEQSSDSGVSPPVNDSNGFPYAISHVDFCFDYEVAVAKTADPSFTRTYAWSIDKTAPRAEALLAAHEVLQVPYTVTVTRTGFVDSDWRVAGTITIHNPAPFPATLVAIGDAFAGLPVVPTCGFELPFELAPGATAVCTYELPLAGPLDGDNVVDVATTGVVGPGSATAAVDFDCAAIDEVDACVDVTDDHAGALGTTCGDVVYEYTLELGPYETCDTTADFVNTASFVAVDTGATGSASWTIVVTVPPCDVGCTLTPGYWKTHSEAGPAPYDEIWSKLPDGASTPFFLSGATYLEVLWTPTAGNAYYTLARAYIAAELNQLAGASGGAVTGTFADARWLLEHYTPAYIGSQRKNSALLARVLADATLLDEYNNGLVGPGHCDE